MQVKEINLKEGMPTVAEALDTLKKAIEQSKHSKTRCLYLIHGYGSTGKGGVIREKVRQWLNAQVRNGKIKTVLYGEDVSVVNIKALELKNKYQGLDDLFRVCNHGVTVVEL